MAIRMAETELAALALAWLESRGLEVFQEVVVGEHRIDLVGRANGRLVTVETKITFGLDVIAQAERWVDEASESWVAIPTGKNRDGHALGDRICRSMGIGVVALEPGRTVMRVTPIPRDPKSTKIRLHADQKDAVAAGSNKGGHATDFKRSAAALTALVRAQPGIELKAALKQVDHHYPTLQIAVSSFCKYLSRVGVKRPDELAGVRIEGVGVRAKLFPMEGEF